nr:N-acetylmuramoyl-L-alanine amidase [uncultured Agathobaculum sp.]
MSSIRCDIYDSKEYDIWFAAAPYGASSKPAKTLKTWAAEEQADVVYNLCLFNMTGSGSDQYGVIRGRTLQYLKAKGVDCGYGGTAERLTVSVGNVVAGVKVAVRDGVVLSGLDKSTYRSRNMIGALADGRMIVVQSSDGCTEEQVARYAAGRYTIKLLLVQDAGGSTGMYRVSDGYLFAPEREGADGRPVCSVVCMRKKNKEGNPMGKKKVFIGVGHGGNDPGAVGYLVEKDVNLTMATACRDFLTAYGVDVKMSRTKDEDDTVGQEIAECNAYAPDLAIDVHNNSGGGDGFEVFHTIHGGTGKVLAQNIEKHVKAMGQNSRGVKTRQGSNGDYYAFIRETVAPAVICEGVFVDTKADAAQADTLAEQQAFGVAYAKGILDTLGLAYDEPEDDLEEESPDEPEQPAKEHWAQQYYDSLIAKGVKIEATRFDDPITRGEVFALLDRIVK